MAEQEREHTLQILVTARVYGYRHQVEQFVDKVRSELELQFQDAITKVECQGLNIVTPLEPEPELPPRRPLTPNPGRHAPR